MNTTPYEEDECKNTKDLYGRLQLLKRNKGQQKALFACSCGKKKKINYYNVTSGKVKSCGCYNSDVLRKRNTKHGLANRGRVHSIYKKWLKMKERCNNVHSISYKNYGGRGIKVCKRWDQSFLKFYEDMGGTWEKGLTLDRIDVNKNYSPDNCKWSTFREQQNNKRNNVYLFYLGKKYTLSDIARKHNISPKRLRTRLVRDGWPLEKAILTPLKK